jgi:hypothetical protein
VGAAHRHRHGVALILAKVSGGDAIIRPLLERLGFAVRVRRNPHWTWEEVVLACDLVRDDNWAYLAEEDPQAILTAASGTGAGERHLLLWSRAAGWAAAVSRLLGPSRVGA